MNEVTADTEEVADVLLRDLQCILGTEVFSALSKLITRDYLGDEMDLRTAIIYRPELFECAFIGVIGAMGEKLLEYIWSSKLQEQFKLTSSETFQSVGDLAKCIRAIHGKANVDRLDL